MPGVLKVRDTVQPELDAGLGMRERVVVEVDVVRPAGVVPRDGLALEHGHVVGREHIRADRDGLVGSQRGRDLDEDRGEDADQKKQRYLTLASAIARRFARRTTPVSGTRTCELARKILEGLASRDAAVLIELSHPDVELHSFFALAEGGVYRGPEGTRRYMSDLADAWEIVRAEVDDALGIADIALLVGWMHSRSAARAAASRAPLPTDACRVPVRQAALLPRLPRPGASFSRLSGGRRTRPHRGC